MRWPALLALACLALVGPTPSAADEHGGQTDDSAVPGELIVGFVPGVSEAERDEVVAAAGGTEKDELEQIDAELVQVDPERTEEALKVLESDARVGYAVRNVLLAAADHSGAPSDPSFHELWGLHNFGQTVNGVAGAADEDIDALEAWATTTGNADVVVAVIDTGVDYDHPDLAGRIWTNPGESGDGRESNGIDDDGNGYVDDVHGWDFANNDTDPFDDSFSGHGTHVAGTIGAVGNNGVGVTGVNWDVRIMPLKFLNRSGFGSNWAAAEAVLYAASNGAVVTNNSYGCLGSGCFVQAFLDAILEASRRGSLFVAAAGNNDRDTDLTPVYPASYDAPNVVSVAATDSRDARASFSNHGRASVDLGAPGVNVFSTSPGGGYRYLSGTSMATAYASGTAALTKAAFPAASHLGIKALLLRSVDANASLAGRTASEGRLNAHRAVTCADQPQVWIDAPGSGFIWSTGEAERVRVIAATCGTPDDVTVEAGANGAPIALTPRGGGLYVGTYDPAAAGPVTVSASATAGAATDTVSVSGTAVRNYRFGNGPVEWIDASEGGTDTGIRSDDTSRKVDLPFTFVFYNEPFTSVQISSNGYLVFGTSPASSFSNQPIPTRFSPNGLVAPFWDDLNPGARGSIWTKVTGTAPDRRFVVTWKDVPHFPAVGTVTFTAVLEEATNDIRFQYRDLDFGAAAYDYGASATVGVENLTGTIGKQFSRNETALRFYAQEPLELRATSRPGMGITTLRLANASFGQPYSQFLYAAGGTAPYTWSLAEGDLPRGLTLDETTGELSGAPIEDGSHRFRARATDSGTPARTAEKTFLVEVFDSEFPGTTISSLPFKETQDTRSAGPDGPRPCGVYSNANATWYSWTAPSDQTVTANTFGSRYDTVLAVWTGDGVGSLRRVACNDDTSFWAQSSVTFAATAGTTYRFQITSFDGWQGGPLTFFVTGSELETGCFPEGWSVLGSATWWCESRDITARGTSFDSILASPGSYSDFELSAKVSTINREASLAFRLQDQGNTYVLIFIPDGVPFRGGIYLARRVRGVESYPFFAHPIPFPRAGEEVVLGVKAVGSRFDLKLNGATIGTVHDATYASGRIGLRIYGDPGLPVDAQFEDVAVEPLADED